MLENEQASLTFYSLNRSFDVAKENGKCALYLHNKNFLKKSKKIATQ